VSNGKGRHKSWLQQWLQQLEPESSEILRVELVTSQLVFDSGAAQLRVNIRAELDSFV
jgi:hypothetical protein